MLNRMADDHDLGGSIVFLLSEASRYVTGANLPVDGGYTAK
jgi:NAD(P)-dependent dehydrogenase (short-subunit alcohol dehydrogenase family)